MRRLLVPVAALAAALLAPSAALATTAPAFATPANPFYTQGTPINLTWSSVGVLVTYRVFRDLATGGACLPTLPPGADLRNSQIDSTGFNDSLGVGISYCYYLEADDLLTGPADSPPLLAVNDVTPPSITAVTPTGADGCGPGTFIIDASGVAVTDSSPVTLSVDTQPTPLPLPYTPPDPPYTAVSFHVIATDAAGNSSTSTLVSGHTMDLSGPGPVSLEVTTDPAQQRASLAWDPVAADGAPVQYRLRTKGPQGPSQTQLGLVSPVVEQNLQVDATYEFTLDATDACGRTTSSVRLVRLNDSTPPSAPIVAGPSFDYGAKSVKLSWVASSDNIQVDHYVILRDGVPLGATDATTFVDATPPQYADLTYLVRAVDTNGNSTNSAPAPIVTPDWTPPTAPVPGRPTVKGTTVTLQWPPAVDNVGVVGYDVFRDDIVNPVGTMTAAKRTYQDFKVKPGVHTWRVRSRDDADLTATSGPVSATVRKAAASRANVLGLRMVGGGSGAARYSLKARGRLLVDLRVFGTIKKPRLRIWVASGRGRVTVWRGTPGSSSPRLRLGSSLVRHGYVTIRLNRAFHAGRSRLVLIAGRHVVIVGTGAHKPAMKAG
jgi:hypothetical protein